MGIFAALVSKLIQFCTCLHVQCNEIAIGRIKRQKPLELHLFIIYEGLTAKIHRGVTANPTLSVLFWVQWVQYKLHGHSSVPDILGIVTLPNQLTNLSIVILWPLLHPNIMLPALIEVMLRFAQYRFFRPINLYIVSQFCDHSFVSISNIYTRNSSN